MPAEVPAELVADSLSPARLWRSYTSEVCPACGRRKCERLVLCFPCVDRLDMDGRLALQYARYTPDDYRAAVAEAFMQLDVRAFIDPPPAGRCQRFHVRPHLFTRGRMEESRVGKLCPACGGGKLIGKRLCINCLGVLRGVFFREKPDRVTDWRRSAEFEHFLCSMRVDGPRAAVNFHKAFVMLDADTFYMPVE
jgi:hypothetical protein